GTPALKAVDVFRAIESLPFSRESSELFDRPSINLGRILGGDALNKVPDTCIIDIDVRYLPEQDPGEILAAVRELPDVEVVRTFMRVPAHVSRTDPYAGSVSHAGKRLNLRSELTAAEAGAPQPFLVIGSDARVADRRKRIRGNSDTMILVRLDPAKRASALLSIPRALKVTIDLPNGAVKTAKINNAYFEGGPRLAVQTIRRVLHV